MWEKKDDASGSLRNMNNTYPWADACSGDGSTLCGTDAECAAVGGTGQAADGQNPSPPTFGLTIYQWVAKLNAEVTVARKRRFQRAAHLRVPIRAQRTSSGTTRSDLRRVRSGPNLVS
jgi:hypothetical protein